MKRLYRALRIFGQEDLRTVLWIVGALAGLVLLVTIIRPRDWYWIAAATGGFFLFSSGFVILFGGLSRDNPEQNTQFLVAIVIPWAVFFICLGSAILGRILDLVR